MICYLLMAGAASTKRRRWNESIGARRSLKLEASRWRTARPLR